MPLYQVIVLAIVQGFTEFLPISSTAHLTLIPWLFGWKDQGLGFDIALHVGTLAAVLIYFFKDWLRIVTNKSPRLLWFLAAASIPVGLLGYLFKEQAEHAWRSPYVIGTMLILIGILMAVAERVGKLIRNLGQINWTDAMTIGLAQGLAIVPGTSRSGVTIAAGLFRDFDRQAAARFSFLLSTPAIAAAAAKDFWDLHKHGGIPPEMKLPFLIGIIVSGVTGALVISFFLKYLRKHGLSIFIYYRIIFGIIVIALAAFFRF